MKVKNTLITAGLVTSMSTISSAATILTGSLITGNQNTTVSSDHGTDAIGTPNIALNWSADQGTAPPPPNGNSGYRWDNYTNWNTRGPAFQINNESVGSIYTITFTPDAGFDVKLTGFDFDLWAGGDTKEVDWTITGSSSGVLNSGTLNFNTTGLNAVNLGNTTGSGSETLTLDLAPKISTTTTYLALDNLSFDQVTSVPEPSSSALFGLGAIALIMRRRK